jgi:Uma2 family endonuclease
MTTPIKTMPAPTLETPLRFPSGNIIAVDVSHEEYMERYAADFCEWVEGTVIAMPPVMEEHDDLTQYLIALLNTYFVYRPVGKLRHAPFVMKLEKSREPDLQIVLNEHQDRLKRSHVDGAADICIEIVSEESIARDYGEKLREYEKGGVQEYWIFDPDRKDARFYRLDENGKYHSQSPDTEGIYRTLLLPDLAFETTLLWHIPLPNPVEIVAMITKMLAPKP